MSSAPQSSSAPTFCPFCGAKKATESTQHSCPIKLSKNDNTILHALIWADHCDHKKCGMGEWMCRLSMFKRAMESEGCNILCIDELAHDSTFETQKKNAERYLDRAGLRDLIVQFSDGQYHRKISDVMADFFLLNKEYGKLG